MHCFRSFFCITLILACFAAAFAAAADDAGWVSLFNGKNLDGWIQRNGKARYEVVDGTIVGTTVLNTPNSFLCTEKHYGDFVLELEFKVDPGLNSGIQIRSNSYSDYRKWRVHGYQVEIDPSERAWSGGIYDEARRGWVNNLEGNEAARKAFKLSEWNHYKVQAIGDRIQTWVNGVPAADLVDPLTQSGFIALQVHSTRSKEPLQIRWRNIRIKDLGRSYWQPIFNSKDLSGWHALPGGQWVVKNGIIHGTSQKSESRHGLLVSDATYGDFTARVTFKSLVGNSGFYFRAEKVKGSVGVHGFQAEIAVESAVGGLYETGGRGWVKQVTPEMLKQCKFKPGDWNTMTVSARGKRIAVHLNGRKTAELKNDPGRTSGHLALQLHGNADMDVQFKEIAILTPEKSCEGVQLFRGNLENWIAKGKPEKNLWAVGTPAISADNPKHLATQGGKDAMINLCKHHGESLDFYSKEKFGDCRIELEVMVPLKSNSGIYVMGEYEIQVLDSHDAEKGLDKKMGPGDMGAIYGASPPPINASKAPGQWQKYVIEFQAPRFDAAGKKVANAQFLSVMLNGRILHRNLEMNGPTPGGVSGKEAPTGPLMFQGNHGPVAYRNITILPR